MVSPRSTSSDTMSHSATGQQNPGNPKFPQPTNQRKLREFLGLVNFYRRFIPHGATLLHPLNRLSKSSPKVLIWNSTTPAAFNAVKDALTEATLLAHPKAGATTCIMTDAQWELCCSSMLMGSGSRWCTSPGTSNLAKPGTVCTIESCWQYTWQ